MFSETVGKLDGCYRIKLDITVKHVQHPPRKVPVPLYEKLKKTLDDLSQRKIIAKVVSPTKWVSSMLVVHKKNNSLRICLDPKDPNQAIRCEIYLIPTVKEIPTKYSGAQLFTVVDVKSGFWHISLHEESTYSTF